MAEAILDANVLLRYLTDEPKALSDRAVRMLQVMEARRITPVVAPLTLAEIVFVLESVYEWKRRDIAERLLTLLGASVIEFLEHEVVTQALSWYRDFGSVHFADAYVAALAARRSARLVSFDRGLKQRLGSKVIGSPEEMEAT